MQTVTVGVVWAQREGEARGRKIAAHEWIQPIPNILTQNEFQVSKSISWWIDTGVLEGSPVLREETGLSDAHTESRHSEEHAEDK